MINIRLEYADNKYEIRASGHAEYNPGNDIVCSAISCLIYTLAGYLENKDNIKKEHSIMSGNAYIKAEGDNLEDAFKMFCIGVKQVELRYPDYVNFSVSDKIMI